MQCNGEDEFPFTSPRRSELWLYNGDYLFYVDTWPINSHYSTPREEHLFSNSEDRDEFVVLFYLVPSSLYFTLHQRPTRLQMRVYGLCIACVSPSRIEISEREVIFHVWATCAHRQKKSVHFRLDSSTFIQICQLY